VNETIADPLALSLFASRQSVKVQTNVLLEESDLLPKVRSSAQSTSVRSPAAGLCFRPVCNLVHC